MVIQIHKLNESYSAIEGPHNTLVEMMNFLRVKRPDAFFDPLVKAGLKSPHDYFATIQHDKLLVMNGHLQLLKPFGVEPEKLVSDYSGDELDAFISDISGILPFMPYDYQIQAFREALLGVKGVCKMCTSSGKSLTIALIAEFFRRLGKRGILLVPNINLLTQFKGDIYDYNLRELFEETHVIGGGQTERHFDKSLTISTWQSMLGFKTDLSKLDYVICDETHRFASQETSEIVRNTLNCKYKWGFTGTIPESAVMKMQIIGLFGFPKTYITSAQLIKRGLATPIKINKISLRYSKSDRDIFTNSGLYSKQLKFIKEHDERNKFITKLATALRSNGNTLILFQHTDHGKTIFMNIMGELFPDVVFGNKEISGKKSFQFQEKYGTFFLNGEDDAKTRELTRNVFEEHENATLVSNYQILSTGVNIRNLHNMLLASPIKAYTTVTQSIGRGMRLHESKKVFTVFDFVDEFPIFKKQFQHRVTTSYDREDYPIKEYVINL